MRTIATVVALTALLAAGVAAGAPATAGKGATVRVTSSYPLTLRGAAFRTRERVTLTVEVQTIGFRRVRRLTTDAAGRFTARFPTLMGVDRCEITATALGARGSRAALKTPQLQCRPRP